MATAPHIIPPKANRVRLQAIETTRDAEAALEDARKDLFNNPHAAEVDVLYAMTLVMKIRELLRDMPAERD